MDAQAIRRRADELLTGMTLTQKIGQITQLYYDGTNFEEMQEIIRTVQPGSLIVCGSALAGNEEQMPVCRERLDALQNTAVEENGIPILFGRDIIHGHRVVLPVPLTMSAAFDPALVQEGYDAVRQEAVYKGIKWTFAPMADLSRDSRWGRIIEGPGENPYVGEQMTAAIVRGFQTEDLSDEQAMAVCPSILWATAPPRAAGTTTIRRSETICCKTPICPLSAALSGKASPRSWRGSMMSTAFPSPPTGGW